MTADGTGSTRVDVDRAGAHDGDAADGRRPLRLREVTLALTALSLWVLWRTGPSKVPFLEGFEKFAREWPDAEALPREAYVLRNFLGPLLYQGVPDPSPTRFLALHVVATALTAALLGAWLLRRLGSRTGPTAIALLLLSPVTALLLLWIGIYDAFGVLVWVLLLMSLAGRPWLQVLAGALAGAQNLEQVGVGIVLLALVPELQRAAGLRARPVALLAGAVLGRVLLEAYLRSAGAPSGSRLTFLSDPELLQNVTKTFAVMAPVVLFSVLGGLWGFALTHLRDHAAGWARSLQLRVALVLALALGFSFLAADHTRVLLLITFPLLVCGVLALAPRIGDLRALARRPEAWLLVLVPPVLVQDDNLLRIGIKLGTWGVGPF